jgi:hypothetical protein
MRKFADVGAGDEGHVAGAREDDALHGCIGLGVLEGRLQIYQGRRVQRVKDLWTINGDVGDAILFSVKHVRECQSVGHCCLLWPGRSERRS